MLILKRYTLDVLFQSKLLKITFKMSLEDQNS